MKNNLENTKLFLNMVVHDMRNPTNQIDFLKKSLQKLSDLKVKLEDLKIKAMDIGWDLAYSRNLRGQSQNLDIFRVNLQNQ